MLKILPTEATYKLYGFVITDQERTALSETGRQQRFKDPLPQYRATLLKKAAKSAIASVMDDLPTVDYLKLSKVFLTRAYGSREIRLETSVKGKPWVCQKVLTAEIYTPFSDEELQKAIDEVIEEYKKK